MRKPYLRADTIFLSACILASCVLMGVARAEEAYKKHEVDAGTFNEQKNSTQVFKTLPSLHLSPADDQLLLSVAYSHTDLHTDYKKPAKDGVVAPVSQSLKLNGYSIHPMIGITKKMAGIGISTEIGEGHSKYKDFDQGFFERGVLRYTGVGLHVFFNPTPDAKSIYLTTNLNLRALNVKQKAKHQDAQSDSEDSADLWESYSYLAYRSHAGANLVLKPFKSFSIIPWGNVGYTYRPAFSDAMQDDHDALKNKERFAADSDHFLSGGTRLEYGIDLALKINQFEIHFGNLIGSVLAARQEKDKDLQVRDHSLTVGVSFQTPAKRTSN